VTAKREGHCFEPNELNELIESMVVIAEKPVKVFPVLWNPKIY
jgi:hypothetical protein